MNANQQANAIAALLREFYKTEEGPRLIHEMMEEFPHPRRVLVPADDRKPERWGMPTTSSAGR